MPKRKRYNLSVDSIHDSKIGIKYHLDDKLVDLLNNLDRRINWLKTLVNSTYGLPAKIEPLEKIVADEDKDKIELLEKLKKHYCKMMWDGRSSSDAWVIQECVDLIDKELANIRRIHESS